MATRNIETNARKLHAGVITFGTYATAVRDEYERMAAMLTRRWAPPGWLGAEDVVQDLLVGTWESIWKFDASAGPTIGNYVVYSSISLAKRKLHKARGAKLHGSPDRNPSRMEVSFTNLGMRAGDDSRESVDEMISRLSRRLDAGWEESAEDRALAAEHGLARVSVILAHCADDTQRKVISAIAVADADVGRAADILCRDEDFRRPLGVEVDEVDVMAAFAESIAGDVARRAYRAGVIDRDRLARAGEDGIEWLRA
jgi:DNA-directed RNA polymerase specialized sigma24 family protein